MSINAILNNGLSGLLVNQQALRVTSDNISNVNTDGYVRKVVEFQNRIAGSQSAGVEIAGIQRVVDAFLQKASYSSAADSMRYKAMSDMENRLQGLFGTPDQNSSFSGKIDAVFSAIADAALDPSTAVRRQAVLSSISDFGYEVSRVAGQVQDLRQEASNRISEDVTTINSALERIYKLNPLIVRQSLVGGDSSALEEDRAAAIKQISELLDIRVQDVGNGAINLSTTSGVSLLDGALYKLSYNAPGTVTPETKFPAIQITRLDPSSGQPTSSVHDLDSAIRSGEIKGLLDMRDNVLPDLANQVGELSAQFMDQLNAAHNANTSFPPPSSLTGHSTGVLGTDLQGFTGQAEFAAVDASGNLISSVTIDFGALAPGATVDDVVTAVNAGLGGAATMSFNNGVMSFTGAGSNRVAIGQVAGDASDRGGHGFSQFFGLNDLVTSAVPSNFDTGFSTTDANGFTPGGTMNLELVGPNGTVATNYTLTAAGGSFGTILTDLNTNLAGYMSFSLDSDGALVTTPASGYESYKIRVISDSTQRGGTGTSLSQLFGIGDSFTAKAANDLQVNPVIANDQTKLALGQLDTSGLLGTSVLAAGDDRGAQALSAVATKPVSFANFGGLKSISATIGQYGAMILSNTGVIASQVEKLAQDNISLRQEIDQRQSDASGVNLDEELSNMIVYQNAYAAAGRVIKVAQDIYDVLLQTV
jgi:flagellar hook-associated protein 1